MKEQRKPLFGFSRFGKSALPALYVAAPAGLLIALGLGAVVTAFSHYQLPWWTVMSIFTGCFLLPCAVGAWVLIVDPETIRNTSAHPEQKNESRWLTEAAAISYFLCFALAGLGSGLTSMLGYPNLSEPLSFIALSMSVILPIVYLFKKFRG